MGRASGRKKQRRQGAEGRDERHRLGAHYTPPWLAEDVVSKALYPHLLWMSQDPEGWDRAHRRPEPKPRDPHPMIPGCYCDPTRWFLRRECPTHGVEAEQARYKTAEHQRRWEAWEKARFGGDDPTSRLLIALNAAVPLWIHEMRHWGQDERISLAHSLAQTVASKGDALQFGSKRKGETAEVFNCTAKGIAALAYQPGGVDFCGVHWEATSATYG
jgi:hypothetical protein